MKTVCYDCTGKCESCGREVSGGYSLVRMVVGLGARVVTGGLLAFGAITVARWMGVL